MSESDKITVSWDDLKDPKVDKELTRQQQAQQQVYAPAPAPGGKSYPPPRQYGSIAALPTAAATRSGIYSTPLYTCLAGLAGALIGWALTESMWGESAGSGGNILVHSASFFGLIGACLGAAVGAVEGIMSRAADKAFKGGAIGFIVGLIGCGIGGMIAQLIYSAILSSNSEPSLSSYMTARTIGWGVAGCFVGLGQGFAMLSGKKILNGFLGGLGGGLIGGFLFDPISLVTQNGIVSRLVGLALIGAAAGLLMGLVEQWLKDAWLHVTTGPLTGKQFVIYKNPTVIGSSPKCDIYLFKDPAIEPHHASISHDGRVYSIEDVGTPAGTLVNGRRIGRQRLQTGDRVQLGSTSFLYSERAGRPSGTPASA
jgi:hypothetical protein